MPFKNINPTAIEKCSISPIRIFLHMPWLVLRSSGNAISHSNTFPPQPGILQVPASIFATTTQFFLPPLLNIFPGTRSIKGLFHIRGIDKVVLGSIRSSHCTDPNSILVSSSLMISQRYNILLLPMRDSLDLPKGIDRIEKTIRKFRYDFHNDIADFLKFRRARFANGYDEAKVFWLCLIELVVTYLLIKEILEVDFEIGKLLYLKAVSDILRGYLDFVPKHCFQTHRSCLLGTLAQQHYISRKLA